MKNFKAFVFAFGCALATGAALADNPPQISLPQMAPPQRASMMGAHPMPPASTPGTQVASAAPMPTPAPLPAPAPTPPFADGVMVSMHNAEAAYQAGMYKNALKFTDQAEGDIRTKHAALYRSLLPPAPAVGWVSQDKNDNNSTLGAALAGGMAIVSRDYKGGTHTASISYVVDSPMLTMVSGMLGAVAAASGPNSEAMEIKGNKALYREQAPSDKGEAHQLMIYAGDVMVMVQSNTLPKNTLVQFANIVDYDKLKTVP
jgi:hypothetical protein